MYKLIMNDGKVNVTSDEKAALKHLYQPVWDLIEPDKPKEDPPPPEEHICPEYALPQGDLDKLYEMWKLVDDFRIRASGTSQAILNYHNKLNQLVGNKK